MIPFISDESHNITDTREAYASPAEVVAELNRVKVLFQLRAIRTAMGIPSGSPGVTRHFDHSFHHDPEVLDQ